MKRQIIKIKSKAIDYVGETLNDYGVSGKILYVSGHTVDRLYGDNVRSQLKEIGNIKHENVGNNTISYSMSIRFKKICVLLWQSFKK